MTDLAWMPLYIGDEAAVSGHLNAEEFGAYERLRRHFWQHGNLPDDQSRLSRITGVDPDRWEAVREAIEPLVADAMGRLVGQRSEAETKRKRKVLAGQKGAAKRWGDRAADGNAIGNANSKRMATALGAPLRNQSPPAPPPDEVLDIEGRAYTRTREEIPPFFTRDDAIEWFKDHSDDIFPGDWNKLADLAMQRPLTWEDVP